MQKWDAPAANWVGRLHKVAPKKLKTLQEGGFTGYTIEVQVPRPDKSGASVAKTISIRDFNKLIAYEALHNKNVRAIILLVALSESGLERVINDAFSGVSIDWFGEKIVHYSQWTYEELEGVLTYNREEVKLLYPWSKKDLAERTWSY